MDEPTKQRLLLGREHYGRREFDEAEPLLREVLRVEDRLADVHNMLGVIGHNRGNLVQAAYHFERALALNPGYTEAGLNLAVTYNDQGKYEAARELYARLGDGAALPGSTGLDPFARGKIANMHGDVAQAYADAGLPVEAIVELRKAVALCPEFPDLRTRLGNLLHEAHDLDAARAQYEAVVTARPEYVPARLQLGVTLFAIGNVGAAEIAWKQVLDVDPDNVRARMYLRALDSQRTVLL